MKSCLQTTIPALCGILIMMAPLNGEAQSEKLSAFLSKMKTCDLLDLSSDGAFAEMGPKEQILKPEWLDIVAEVSVEGIPRPRAKKERAEYHREIHPKNERYFTSWPKNEMFRFQIMELAHQLRQNPSVEIKLGDVLKAVDQRIQLAQAQGEVGECYKISQVTGTFNSEWIQQVALSLKAQREIDELFSRAVESTQLSEKEASLLSQGILNLQEISELRALRMATKIFEDNTVLKDDMGGFQGNMDFAPGKIRSVCRTEAQTYYFFLRRLQSRGLLKAFRPSETWAYRKRKFALDGHGATLLESKRTGQLFVLDSWHENGGIPAHLTLFQDWVQEKDKHDVVSVD